MRSSITIKRHVFTISFDWTEIWDRRTVSQIRRSLMTIVTFESPWVEDMTFACYDMEGIHHQRTY